MLRHIDATGGGGEGDSCRDVERVGTVTTGATGVDHRQIRPGAGEWAGISQNGRHGRKLIGDHSLGSQTSEKRSCLNGFELLGKPCTHQFGGLIGAEVVALQQMLQATGPRTRV